MLNRNSRLFFTALLAVVMGVVGSGSNVLAQSADKGSKPDADRPHLELAEGVDLEITELERLEDIGVLQLTFEVTNNGADSTSLQELGIGLAFGIGEVSIIDFTTRTSYAKGYAAGCLCSTFPDSDGGVVPVGETREYWAWFGLPAEGTTLVAVQFADRQPILNVPVSK